MRAASAAAGVAARRRSQPAAPALLSAAVAAAAMRAASTAAAALPRGAAAAASPGPRGRPPPPAPAAVRLADVPTRGRPRESSAALKTARVALRKRFGQHLLKNADVVRNIVEAAQVRPHESVFEIGPGTGNMTVHLLERAAVVYAVELDPRLHAVVTARAAQLGAAHKFQCVRADFLDVPLPAFDVLVANIPYQISSPVVRRILGHSPLPSRAVIMFQFEFAARLVARPGTADYCRLSVNTQLLCSSARIVMKVGRGQFRPPPKVDSAVAELVPRTGGWPAVCAEWPALAPPTAEGTATSGTSAASAAASPSAAPATDGELASPFTPPSFDDWDCFLRLAFGGKNKTLRAVFSNKNTLADLLQASTGAPSAAAAGASSALPAATALPLDDDDDVDVGGAAGTDSDDDEEITVATDAVAAASAGGGGAVLARFRRDGSGGRVGVDKVAIRALRERIHGELAGLGMSGKRPNALTIPEYQRLYRALSQTLGLRFRPPGEAWGAGVRRQRGEEDGSGGVSAVAPPVFTAPQQSSPAFQREGAVR